MLLAAPRQIESCKNGGKSCSEVTLHNFVRLPPPSISRQSVAKFTPMSEEAKEKNKND